MCIPSRFPEAALYVRVSPCDVQDPFKLDNRLHAELANVARAWPSVSGDSRLSDLRMRSNTSRASVRSVGSGRKIDILVHQD